MADNGAKYAVSDVKAAIEAEGAAPARIAKRLGCSRTTVYGYLRKYPELKRVYESLKGEPISDQVQYTRAAFETAIEHSHGIISAVAAAVGCSRGTVENALERWPDLRERLEAQRGGLVALATSALVNDLKNAESDGHQRAYMFTLKTLGKDDGFSDRREITGADGAGLLEMSPEVTEMIRRMGLDTAEVVRQFESMVRMAAEQKAG